MTLNNNIIKEKSQLGWGAFLYILLIPLFFLIISLNTVIYIKILLTIFLGIMPFFIKNPFYFLLAIFLVTPGIRELSQTETISYNDFTINLNFLINISILFFGGFYILKNIKQVKKLLSKYKSAKLFLFFVILSLISILYSISKYSSFEESMRVFTIFILFIYSYLTIKNKTDFYRLIGAILIGLLIPIIVTFFQFFSGTGWWDKTIMLYRVKGTFMHPATLAFYLLLTLPMIYALLFDKINKKIKNLLLILLFLNISIILISLTRGAWVGLLAIMFFYGVIRNRKFLLASFLFLLLLYISVPTINNRINDIFKPKYNSSFTTRIKIVESCLPAITDNLFLGSGFGTFGEIHLKYNEEARTYDSLQAHNDYLRILIELGVIGLIIYLSIFIYLFLFIKNIYKGQDKNIKNYLFSVILIWLGALSISTGDNILRTMPVQFLLWTYTGAVLAFANLDQKKSGDLIE